MSPEIDLLLDYIRMVSYTIVIMTSIRCIMRRKLTTLLFVGDIILASMLVFTLAISNLFGGGLKETADILLTPASVIWAVTHYVALLK